MSEVNKCNVCGKFKPWEGLKGLAGDCDEIGNYDQWFECVDCMCGSDLREFAKRKIKEITALKAELSEFMDGLPIEKADEKKQYFYFPYQFRPCRTRWFPDDKAWFYMDVDGIKPLLTASNIRLFPIPSQRSETQEGNE